MRFLPICSATIYVTILFADVISAQITLTERDNASQSLWLQFQRKNIFKSPSQTNRIRFPIDSKGSLDSLIKPNYKPKFPFYFPTFMEEKRVDNVHQMTNREFWNLLTVDNFNDKLMSIDKPSSSASRDGLYLSKALVDSQKRQLKRFIRKILKLFHAKTVRATIDRDFRRKLRNMMNLFSMCPVRYHWKDMGPKFWPRWIKQGSCAKLSKSCSYPEGLVCQEYQHRNIAVLRFLCMSDWPKSKCKWYKIYIPFLLTCKCGCNG